jgi:uncharacterized phage-like protein YoqJ
VILSFTGHRPQKLGGYSAETSGKLTVFASKSLEKLSPSKCIIGMAIGWDMAVARSCARMGIPFVAAVPFVGQEKRWPDGPKREYARLLRQADSVEVIAPGGYEPFKMHLRNHWMVNNSNKLVALWNGDRDGGTFRCVEYAKTQNRPIINLWEDWENWQRKAVL